MVQEYLTKWPCAFAMSDQKADTITQILVEEIFLQYGPPKILLSDRGSNFMSKIVAEINDMWQIKRCFTTPYHPQTDGMVERFNRTLAQMLSNYVDRNQKNWDVFLPYVIFAYRTNVHSSTLETPFYLMYGRDPLLPLPSTLNLYHANYYNDLDNYKANLVKGLEIAWATAASNLKAVQNTYKGNAEKDCSFKVGDLVRIFDPQLAKGQIKKFSRNWRGPYRVLMVLPTNFATQ